ncbi:response regulator transcription factor [Streptomyces sp. NPDC058457]|uniref:response regulator n=1 Tax=Streptomyces sp. NPDC058457 TaxID=3346507 RepID=UPI003659BA79
MAIRVLLADDQALLRATFRILIDSVEDMTVVAEAADGREAVDLTAEHRPDVVIMDIRTVGAELGGGDTARHLQSRAGCRGLYDPPPYGREFLTISVRPRCAVPRTG